MFATGAFEGSLGSHQQYDNSYFAVHAMPAQYAPLYKACGARKFSPSGWMILGAIFIYDIFYGN